MWVENGAPGDDNLREPEHYEQSHPLLLARGVRPSGRGISTALEDLDVVLMSEEEVYGLLLRDEVKQSLMAASVMALFRAEAAVPVTGQGLLLRQRQYALRGRVTGKNSARPRSGLIAEGGGCGSGRLRKGK